MLIIGGDIEIYGFKDYTLITYNLQAASRQPEVCGLSEDNYAVWEY